jgi:flavodoxin I
MGKLFYGSQTGTTTRVAKAIQKHLNGLVSDAKCIHFAQASELAACDFLILGGATYGDGELTDDWKQFWPQMDSISFAGKKVALFALGDQVGYSYTFVSAMRKLYDKVRASGAQVIADDIPTAGFEFNHSESVVDGCFVGLVIDEDNQPELTQCRIEAWANKVRQQLLVACSI